MNKFINHSLKRELNEIIENGWTPTKGTVGGHSIEILEGQAYSSYIYYEDETSRDKDFDTLMEKISG